MISSDATASAVTANLRSAGQGKLRLTLGEKTNPSAKIAAELVSDLGELVAIDKLDEAIPVPFGQYRVSSLKVELPDSAGQTWTYNFYNEKTKKLLRAHQRGNDRRRAGQARHERLFGPV